MLTVIFALLALIAPETGELAAGARATAPDYLTPERAFVHAHAAVTAGAVYAVDPALLLAIAHHESRYDAAAVSSEPGGKTSCGVMTPVPRATCRTRGVIAGYLDGAEHVRTWLDASRGNVTGALIGYAGGYALRARCAQGPVIIRRRVDACRTPALFLARARAIRTAGQRSLAPT